MEFTLVTGYDISWDFYTEGKCALEDIIENSFYRAFETVNPLIKGRKESIAGKPTDGIIRFYNEDKTLKTWILQETKRDVGPDSVFYDRSFLQAIMYLGNVYYDSNILRVDKFGGIFLDSARYFSYISKEQLEDTMIKFEPLWNKYNRISPSKAYTIQELYEFAANVIWEMKPTKYFLSKSFRLNIILEQIYNKY